MVLKPGREAEAEAIFRKMGAGLRGHWGSDRYRTDGSGLERRNRCSDSARAFG